VSPIRPISVPALTLKRGRAFVWKIDPPVGSSPPPEDGSEYSTEDDSDATPEQEPRDKGREVKAPVPKAKRSNINFYKARVRPVLVEARKHWTDTLYHKGFFPTPSQRSSWGAAAFKHGCQVYSRRTHSKRTYLLLLSFCTKISLAYLEFTADTLSCVSKIQICIEFGLTFIL
jgi:hypothetical protein